MSFLPAHTHTVLHMMASSRFTALLESLLERHENRVTLCHPVYCNAVLWPKTERDSCSSAGRVGLHYF